MSKPSLLAELRDRKARAWLAFQHRPNGATMRELHEDRNLEARVAARRAPAPRIPAIGRTVAKLRGRVAELEQSIEESELDSIMTEAGMGGLP